jgi:hypothetical protein
MIAPLPLRQAASDVVRLARLTRDLPGALRSRATAEGAAATVRQRLATREERFLELCSPLVYGRERSPYRRLLRSAGYELGDVRQMVAAEGLEGTLTRLATAGVYVTYDEFKGRKDVVRGSERFRCTEEDFDNPAISPHFEARSGGTRSSGTPVKIDLAFLRDQAVNIALTLQAHGLSDYEHAIWHQYGFTDALRYAGAGGHPAAWFCLMDTLPRKVKTAAYVMAVLARLSGRPLPAPGYLDVRDPSGMVRWLDRRRAEGRLICITTYASSAVRVAAAAVEAGIALRHVCFITMGEPFTDARQRIVEASGARAVVRYAFTEAGILGYSCVDPVYSDDLHLFSDSYALIQRDRAVGQFGPTVEAFLFTSLLPTAPKVLLNVESGDYGIVERRSCGCGLEAAGLSAHVAKIRSFEKLTGEGVTFVQTDLLRVLEHTLPAQFGGTSTDYQILETEGADGITRLLLVISPRIGPVDEEGARRVFLNELGRDGLPTDSSALWRRLDTVRVQRRWPEATRAGKILPFHLVRM